MYNGQGANHRHHVTWPSASCPDGDESGARKETIRRFPIGARQICKRDGRKPQNIDERTVETFETSTARQLSIRALVVSILSFCTSRFIQLSRPRLLQQTPGYTTRFSHKSTSCSACLASGSFKTLLRGDRGGAASKILLRYRPARFRILDHYGPCPLRKPPAGTPLRFAKSGSLPGCRQ